MEEENKTMTPSYNGNRKVRKTKLRILVVEDEDMLRGTITRYLKKLGYKVWSVANGFEALLLLQYHKPHIIITDIRMPKLGGLTMVEGLRNRSETKNVPIILITAYRDEGYFKRAKNAKITYFLMKPFTLSELHVKIISVIDRQKDENKGAEERQVQSVEAF